MTKFFAGFVSFGLIVLGVYALAPEAMIPRNITCGLATKDGCIMWLDAARLERYKNAKAGT
jgi:hypothetical protein